MAQERQADREQITQLFAQITALTTANVLSSPNHPIASIERDSPETTISQSNGAKLSKQRPDPPAFTNGKDPVFESWKI